MKRILTSLLLISAFHASIICPTARGSELARHISMADGLSGDRVFSLAQDNHGFIWAVTYWGVDRLDGRIVKTYQPRHNGQPITHLPYNSKIRISGDWVLLGLQNGMLFRYDPKSDAFQKIADLRALSGDKNLAIQDFCITVKGINIATNRGLYRYVDKHLKLMTGKTAISAIGHYGDNHIYYVANGYLSYLNGNKSTPLANLDGTAGFVYPKGSAIYVGVNDQGLYIYDVASHKIRRSAAKFPKCHFTSVTDVAGKELIIGTDGAGCLIYNVDKDSIIDSLDESSDSRSVGNAVMDVMHDRDSNIWIATFNKALFMIRHNDSRFSTITSDQTISGFGNSLLRSRDGALWVASDNGVFKYNPLTRSWDHHLNDLSPKAIIVSLAEDSDGNIWTAGFGCGIYKIDCNGAVRHFSTSHPLCGIKLASDYVATIKISETNLWIGFYSEGNLMRFNLKDNTAETFDIPDVHSILTVDPYTVICGQSAQFTVLNPITKDTVIIKGYGAINDMSVVNNDIWLATDGRGLLKYNIRHNRINSVVKNNNQDLRYIMALCYSAHDSCLYFTTHRQLYKYSLKNDRIYAIGDLIGLSPTTYNERAMTLFSPSRLLLGSSKGVSNVDIESELYAGSTPYVYFTEFKVAYNIVEPDKNASILTESLNTTDLLELKHNQNSFSLGFSIIDYGANRLTQLQYKLEGFDSGWNDATDYNANYTNVPFGEYKFQLRLKDKITGNILSQRTLNISINSPIWLSWWMIAIYVIIAISLVILFIKLIRTKLHQRYSDEKIRLFTEIAHELRTPVALIKAPLSELADNKNLSKENKATLEIAIRNTDRLHQLTTQLMDFQKLDANAMLLNASTVNLYDFFSQIVAPWEFRAKRKGLTFKTDIRVLQDIHSSLDRSKMDVIIGNLLSNAVKYTISGGIKFLAYIDRNHYLIEISDTGIGIPSNEQRFIFHQFFRAKNARKSNESGTGIGLMLTQRLVQLHNGLISISSKENTGTVVTLRFPIVTECTDTEVNSAILDKDTADETILVVDDNADMRTVLKKTLETSYNVIVAKDGNEALKLAVTEIPDIIVSDLMMPGLNGEELCRKLKGDMATSHIPFILLTAVADHDSKTSAFECGADDYITKPFDNRELKARVRIHLRHSHKLKEALQSPETNTEDADFINPLDKEFMEKLSAIIERNIENTEFNVANLCSEMAMSRSSLYNKLKAVAGQSPNEYIRLIRLKRAASLLKEHRYTIVEIAIMTGFSDTKYFATVFKKQYGVPPSSYSKP